jgi:hypothetical protein
VRLAVRPFPLTCYCADQGQLSQTLSFLKWSWWVLWESPPVINEILWLEICLYFIKINFHIFIILMVNLYFYHSHFIISCNWRNFLYWKPIPTFVRILSRTSELHCNYLHFVWRQWLQQYEPTLQTSKHGHFCSAATSAKGIMEQLTRSVCPSITI